MKKTMTSTKRTPVINKTLVGAFALALLLTASVTGYSQAYKKGDKLLNVGIGLNSYYSGGIPIGASLEFGVTDDISVGPNIDYLSNTYNYGTYSYKFTALYFGGRASYHFNKILDMDDDNFDIYGGADIGYRSFSWSDSYSSGSLGGSYGSGVYFGLHVGGKYYFTKTIGAFAEGGAIGSTNIRVGVGFKL